MTLQVSLRPLGLVPKQFYPGDTIRATVSFKYTVAQDTKITLQAVPYQYKLGVLDRVGSSAGQKEITLTKAMTPASKEVSIDFTLTNIADGKYGLLVEALDTGYYVLQDNLIIVGTGGAGITDVLSMVVTIIMLSVMIPMLEGVEKG